VPRLSDIEVLKSLGAMLEKAARQPHTPTERFAYIFRFLMETPVRPPDDESALRWSTEAIGERLIRGDKAVEKWADGDAVPTVAVDEVFLGPRLKKESAERSKIRETIEKARQEARRFNLDVGKTTRASNKAAKDALSNGGSSETDEPNKSDVQAASHGTDRHLPIKQSIPETNFRIVVPSCFRGREDLLGQMHNTLTATGNAAAIAILHGLPGIGKTVLAHGYASRYGGNCRAVWLVDARSTETMQENLISLGTRLNWPEANLARQAAFDAVMNRLLFDGHGILLIYENASDWTTLKPFIPSMGAARIIVTSNNHDWCGIGASARVEAWTQEVGADFLISRSGRQNEPMESAHALSTALGGLPLAHEQAAAYCAHFEESLADYLKRFEAEPIALLEKEKFVPIEYSATVVRTFTIALKGAMSISKAAEALIVHLAMLSGEPIPIFLVSEACRNMEEPFHGVLLGDGLREALSALRSVSLIDRLDVVDEHDASVRTICFILHRLVREVARNRWWASDERRRALQRMVDALITVFPIEGGDRPEAWTKARRLYLSALSVINDQKSACQIHPEKLRRVLNRVGYYFDKSASNYKSASDMYEKALKIAETLYGDDLITAGDLEYSARMLALLGAIDNASARLTRAVEIQAKHFGLHYHDLDRDISNVNFAIEHHVFGVQHSLFAESINSLGVLALQQKDTPRATKLFESSLHIHKSIHGENHPCLSAIHSNLGSLSKELSDLPGAIAHFRQAIAIHESNDKDGTFDIGITLINLADALRTCGDLGESRKCLERAIDVRTAELGRTHPRTLSCTDRLITILIEQGEWVQAMLIMMDAIKSLEKSPQPDYLRVAYYLEGVAYVRRTLRDMFGARPFLERAFAIREKYLGGDHPETKRTFDVLLGVLRGSGGDRGSATS
jgi:tetratricopeptide (TPR) repeat protein